MLNSFQHLNRIKTLKQVQGDRNKVNKSIMTDGIQHIGKFLILLGFIISTIGALLLLSGKIPWLGRLPGDILIQKKNFTFYFPLVTGIIISLILTLLFWIFGRK